VIPIIVEMYERVAVCLRPKRSDSQPTAMMPMAESMPARPNALAAISGAKPRSIK
jgi:hypothetical protein